MASPGFGRKVLAPQNRSRVVSGRISAASAIVAGDGFTLVDTATGVQTITFNDKPKAIVACVASLEGTGNGSVSDLLVDYASAPTSIIIRNGDGTTAADKAFSFMCHLEY